MKGHTGYKHTHGTEGKIEEHVRKHRKYGGETHTVKGHGKESATKGDDDAEKDLEEDPVDRTAPSKPAKMAEEKSDKGEEHKKGGRVKKHRKEGGTVKGEEHMAHSGRKPRKSGGACEDSPFTTANRIHNAPGHTTMKVSEGKDA